MADIKTLTVTFIAVAIILLVFTIVNVLALSYPERFGYGLVFVAEELTEKPDKCIPLTEPDSYLLQAISNPGEDVVVGSWKNSEFDEMTATYETNNVEINGNYYRIHLYSKDIFLWGTLFLLLIVGWSALGIAIMVKTWKRRQHAKRATCSQR